MGSLLSAPKQFIFLLGISSLSIRDSSKQNSIRWVIAHLLKIVLIIKHMSSTPKNTNISYPSTQAPSPQRASQPTKSKKRKRQSNSNFEKFIRITHLYFSHFKNWFNRQSNWLTVSPINLSLIRYSKKGQKIMKRAYSSGINSNGRMLMSSWLGSILLSTVKEMIKDWLITKDRINKLICYLDLLMLRRRIIFLFLLGTRLLMDLTPNKIPWKYGVIWTFQYFLRKSANYR